MTLSQVLTPFERADYVNYGVLPSRITYSLSQRAYVLNDNSNSVIKNDLRNNRTENRPGYKLMPRWKYILNQLKPDSLLDDKLKPLLLLSSLLGSNYDDNNEKSDDDEKEDEKNDDGSLIKDVLTNDITKTAAKAAVLFFGGPGALAAVEAGSKIADATNISKKIPKI